MHPGFSLNGNEVLELDTRSQYSLLHAQRIVVDGLLDSMAVVWQVQLKTEPTVARIITTVYDSSSVELGSRQRNMRFECTVEAAFMPPSQYATGVLDTLSFTDYRLQLWDELASPGSSDAFTSAMLATAHRPTATPLPTFGFRAFVAWPGNGVVTVDATPPQLAEISRLTRIGPAALGDALDLLRRWRDVGWQLPVASAASPAEEVLSVLLRHGLSSLLCSCVALEPPRFELRLMLEWARSQFAQIQANVTSVVFAQRSLAVDHTNLSHWLSKVETLVVDIYDILQSLLGACDTTEQGTKDLLRHVMAVNCEAMFLFTARWLLRAGFWTVATSTTEVPRRLEQYQQRSHNSCDADDMDMAGDSSFLYPSISSIVASSTSTSSSTTTTTTSSSSPSSTRYTLANSLVQQAFGSGTYHEPGLLLRVLQHIRAPTAHDTTTTLSSTSDINDADSATATRLLLTYIVIEMTGADVQLLREYQRTFALSSSDIDLPHALWLIDTLPTDAKAIEQAVALLLTCHAANRNTYDWASRILELLLEHQHCAQALHYLACTLCWFTKEHLPLVLQVYLLNNRLQSALQHIVCRHTQLVATISVTSL
jgi:hypothetical protein